MQPIRSIIFTLPYLTKPVNGGSREIISNEKTNAQHCDFHSLTHKMISHWRGPLLALSMSNSRSISSSSVNLEKLSSPKGFQPDMSGGLLTVLLQLWDGGVIPSEASRGFLLWRKCSSEKMQWVGIVSYIAESSARQKNLNPQLETSEVLRCWVYITWRDNRFHVLGTCLCRRTVSAV